MIDLPIETLSAPLDDLRPGFYRMEAAHYHASYGVSKSQLDDLDDCPAIMKYRKDHPEKETEAMRVGQWTHAAVFEPDVFAAGLAPTDLDRRGTKAWDAADIEAAAQGRVLIKRPEYQQIVDLADSVRRHPRCEEILSDGYAEVSAFAEDDATGLALRSRLDWIPRSGNAVADLKTCVAANPHAFARAIADGRYHVQAAFYLDQLARLGVHRDCWVIIAVRKEPPYPVAVYQLSPEDIEVGRRIYRRNLERYLDCLISGHWPAYGDQIQPISLPAWATR